MHHCIFYLTSYCLLLTSLVIAEPKLGSLNVCNKTESKFITVKVPIDISYEKDVASTCVGILGCTRKQKVTIPGSKLEQRLVNETKLSCCDGYLEDQNKNCIPVCSNACIHGDCHLPEVCICHSSPSDNAPGWSGHTCNRFTCKTPSRWGSNCEHQCNCSSNGFCDADTGNCVCNIGWGGIECSEPCHLEADCRYANDVVLPRNSALLNIGSSSAEIVADVPGEVESSTAEVVATHVGINLLLTITIFGLLYALLSYRRNLRAVKDELYYVTYSSSSNSATNTSVSGDFDNPVYSLNNGPSSCANFNQRPMLPEPNQQFPGKEQSFLMASQSFGAGPNSSPLYRNDQEKPMSYIINPKVENKLITSKRDVVENVYCESHPTDSASYVAPSSTLSAPNNDYQVPRSPIRVANFNYHLENDADVDSNIYEEINIKKPFSGDT